LVNRPEAARLISSLPPVGAGGEVLAVSAIGAVRVLAAESGHPLPAVVAAARPLASSSSTTAPTGSRLDWRLPAGVFVAVMVFAAAAFEVQRRVATTDVSATDVPHHAIDQPVTAVLAGRDVHTAGRRGKTGLHDDYTNPADHPS
jgi:hypothetical protein